MQDMGQVMQSKLGKLTTFLFQDWWWGFEFCQLLFPNFTGTWRNKSWVAVFRRCTVLHCTVLNCAALYYTALHCTALNCTAMYCTALHWTELCCTVLHCTALNCTALYYSSATAHLAYNSRPFWHYSFTTLLLNFSCFLISFSFSILQEIHIFLCLIQPLFRTPSHCTGTISFWHF